MDLRMAHRTDDYLLNIIDLQFYFHPLVVKAAKKEWDKRKKLRK